MTVSAYILDRHAAREIDRIAIEKYGIAGIVLMENAARAVADQAMHMMDDDPGRVTIVCGVGNNGGDGYAAARHLHNARCDVTLVVFAAPRPESDVAINAEICRRMGLRLVEPTRIVEVARNADVIIDGLFGTGLDRDVTGDPAHLIAVTNELARPILAIDTPSGFDCQTGRELGEAIRAQHTITFVGMKPGFLTEDAQQYTGTISIADIGVPRELIAELGTAIEE